MYIPKSKIFIGIILIMLLTTTAVFAYTTSSKIVFEDDFSAYAENSRVAYHSGGKGVNSSMAAPRGWKWAEAYNTSKESGIVTGVENANTYAKIYSCNDADSISFVSGEFGKTLTNYVISARIKMSENAVGGIGIVNSNASISVGYPLEKLICFKNGALHKSFEEMSENPEYLYDAEEWYNLCLNINRSNYSYSVNIYNESGFNVIFSGSIPTSARANKIRFGCELEKNSVGAVCLDNVLVCEVGTQKLSADEDDAFSLTPDALSVTASDSIVLTTKVLLVELPEIDDIKVFDSSNKFVKIKSVKMDSAAKKLTIQFEESLKPLENYSIVFNPGMRNAFGRKIKQVDFETAALKPATETPQVYINGSPADNLKAGKLTCSINLTATDCDIEPYIAMALYKNDTMLAFSKGNGTMVAKGASACIESAVLEIPEEDISSYKVMIFVWDSKNDSPISGVKEFNTNGFGQNQV